MNVQRQLALLTEVEKLRNAYPENESKLIILADNILKEISEFYSKNRVALTQDEINIGITTGKLNCVRAHKERTGLTLMESKRICEETFEKLGFKFA